MKQSSPSHARNLAGSVDECLTSDLWEIVPTSEQTAMTKIILISKLGEVQ